MKFSFIYNIKPYFFLSALSLSFIFSSCENLYMSKSKTNDYNKEIKKSLAYSYDLIFDESFKLFSKLLILHDKTYKDNILIEEIARFLFIYPETKHYSVEEYYQVILRIKNNKFQLSLDSIIKLCENHLVIKEKFKNLNNQNVK